VIRKFSVLLVACLLFTVCAFAQTVKLTGKVINAKNEPLPGATVTITGVPGSYIADIEGRFRVNLESGKKYAVTITSVGYETKVMEEVEVRLGDDNELIIVMEPNKKTMQGVTVRATTRRVESTMALLNFQKNNASLSSGLAADFIRRTPDKNTGEVLKRVSGASIQDNRFIVVRGLSERYNVAYLNNAQMPSSEPDKKLFSFDVIPSILVDNIIISKTATPDMTGEFAGGLVQIQTKDIPNNNTLTVGVGLGYNTASTFRDFVSNPRNNTDWLGFDNGTRKLPAGVPDNQQEFRSLKIGDQAAASRLFSGDVYKQVTTTAAPIQTYSIAWGTNIRFKNGGSFGTIISAIYRKSMLRFNDVLRGRYQEDREPIFEYTDQQSRYNINWGAMANFTYVKGRHKISFKNLFNRNFEDIYYERSGLNTNRIQNIRFYSSFLNQRSMFSSQLEGEHQLTRSGIKLRWNANGSINFKAQPDLRTIQYTDAAVDPTDKPAIDPDDTRRFYSDLKDYSAGINGSLIVPYKLFGEKQQLKVGGSSLLRFRYFNARLFFYENQGSPVSPIVNLPIDQIFQTQNIGEDKFLLRDITNNTDRYFGVSSLNAGFVMMDNKLTEKLRFIWGGRVEFFEQFLWSRDLSAQRVIVNTETWDFLPSFNLTYSFNNQHLIRMAGAQTVARPEFREIAPFAFFDYEAIYGISGDPELKRTQIYNADLRYEWYPKAGEAVTFGVFYKYFRNPIEFRMDPGSNADRQLYFFQNAKNAHTLGAELEVRKNINPSLSVFGNLTYIYSRVSFNDVVGGQTVTANRPLQGQSPYLLNFGLQYSSTATGINATLLYNRVGERLALVGSPPPNGAGFFDVYERPRDLVDFQIARRILHKRGELKLTWADILNQPIALYDNLTKTKTFKRGDGDRYINRYRPGSTITIAFNYEFDLSKKK
jgi:outer membrane receptor protein involved in Fe transport